MKRSIIKRLWELLCLFLVISHTPTMPVFASYENERASKFIIALSSADIAYAKDGDDVIETITLVDIDREEAVLVRTIRPDGTGMMVIYQGDTVTETPLSGQNYDIFNKIVTAEPGVQTVSGTVGKDITGSQFKHVKLGSTSSTITKAELEQLRSAAGLISLLVSVFGIPGANLVDIANSLIDISANLSPYKINMYQTAYEVLFSYDNAYYIHCYHQTYYSYDVSGTLIDKTKYFTQAIGG